MAKVSHSSPQKTRTNKSRKSILKTLTLVKQNEQLIKKLQNG
jgi:hypothetical protein